MFYLIFKNANSLVVHVLRSSTIGFSIEITILLTRLNPLFVMKYLFFITPFCLFLPVNRPKKTSTAFDSGTTSQQKPGLKLYRSAMEEWVA
jgi:hypothetical protein